MRRTAILAAAAALTMAVSACGSSSKTAAPTDAKRVEVKLTKAGCDPAKLELPAGPTTFNVTNENADAVTEFEVLNGTSIVGEKENLTPGLSGSFTITLKSGGKYSTACPGGTTAAKGEIVVAGGTTETTAPAQLSGAAAQAVATYRTYVESEAAKLTTDTTAFVNAVQAGDVATAKKLFPGARTHYESIEPIAESFGDLDPQIDARANDVPAAEFQGFHRIEQQLWQKGNTEGMSPVATKLLTDVKDLQARIPGIELEPAQLANGAVELLNEVASSKITGEEDRYSHTDLWDFEANLEGARQAFEALKPIIIEKDAALATKLETRFTATEGALGKYKEGDGYQLYTALTKADTRALAAQVDALADALSKIAPLVVSS
jgi:iron uptake system component EfeO